MEAKDIKRNACVGSGVIGYSWALYYSLKGLSVNAYDLTEEKLELAKQRIHESLINLKKNGVVDDKEMAEIEGRINYTTSMEEAVKDVEFITESGPESYEVKQKMVEEMEKYTSNETIISSSTSGLLITQMALYREVCSLVMNGVCTIEDADKAVTYGPGLRWAIMGPSLVFELGGGQGHIDGLMKHLNPSISLWLHDMADFKDFPPEFPEVARKGVEESLKNRPKEIGNDDASLAEYRDKMLIELLKLHNKL